MSIYYSGTFKRSSGLISAISKQLKQINLKPVKRINVQFDPFHPNAVTARDFLWHITSPKVAETNLNCIVKTNVVCDRSQPEIKIDLVDSGCVKFLANNLTVLEILQKINQHICSKIPPEEPASNISNKIKSKPKKR
ncbi:39S ribosomal protein L53, mitochondrial [Aethina tumida]|uniref:39S ribosomal protein L53, mitochondrial n=1 Tax=Aethina tumida TaxID=116153 RepID=UPI00096AF27A|nr:39S ribosomal protein L53, mitochondrial [Aethina tumida]